jgi:hypothetical protein
MQLRLRPVPATRHNFLATFVHKYLQIARTSFSARTQFAGLWSPLRAAPTSYSCGGRRRWNSLCAVSPCRLSRLNLPTFSTRPTAGKRLTTANQPAWSTDATDTYTDYTLQSQCPLSRALQHLSKHLCVGWFRILPQSARIQVKYWLPSNQAVTQQWTGYLATQQYKRNSRNHF